MRSLILSIAISIYAIPTYAFDLWCNVERKLNRETEYSTEYINKWKFAVRIQHRDDSAIISRCGGNSACDDYAADFIEYTKNVGIIKYYYFSGQFDIQVFSDLTFIENNGRGDISFGQCRMQ